MDTIRLGVAVTDPDWFRYLYKRQERKKQEGKQGLDEVNFWCPGAKNFCNLQRGEFFLFKLRGSGRKIVGGGIFLKYFKLSCSLAWDCFRKANGMPSELDLREKILSLRRGNPPLVEQEDLEIGCRILTQPVFWAEQDWFDWPKWPGYTGYKGYSTAEDEGRELWNIFLERYRVGHELQGQHEEDPRFGSPQTIRPRLGQGAFRLVVTDAYHRRCAVTGERTLPVLDAAHIRPYKKGGIHSEDNGLLLRKDVHKLFDDGYVTVTPNYRFVVSDRVKKDFGNGRDYRKLKGEILLPDDSTHHPSKEMLEWHNENCYLG